MNKVALLFSLCCETLFRTRDVPRVKLGISTYQVLRAEILPRFARQDTSLALSRQRLFKSFIVCAALAGFSTQLLGEEEFHLKPVTDPKVNSPREDLRAAIFKASLDKPDCVTISSDPRGNVSSLDAELDSFIKLIIKGLKAKDEKTLHSLFHKRLKITQEAVASTFAKLDNLFGKPFDVSAYRIWALNTVEGSPKGIACNDDRLTVYPQYGYPLQIGLWLQIQGSQELGRLFITLVPADGRWNIGAFHAQKWTHAGKDFATWVEDAQKTSYMGYKESSYVLYDLAAKLLDGGGYIDFALQDDLVKTREAIISTSAWEKSVKASLKDWDVVYTASLFVVDGAGIVVRIRMPQEISVDTIKSECAKVLATLEKQSWHQQLKGIRCNFLMPNEDAAKDGAMGGIYLEFSEPKEN